MSSRFPREHLPVPVVPTSRSARGVVTGRVPSDPGPLPPEVTAVLPTCDHCRVPVHPNWEFCRRCGGELSTSMARPEPRIVPSLPFDRAEAGLAYAARAVRNRWRPLNARLTAKLDDWQRRLDH